MTDGENGLVLIGDQMGDRSGWAVSGAGDVNADGVADIAIGAHFASPAPDRERAGHTYVVFGRSGLGSEGVLELSSLNGISGVVFKGEAAGDQSGWSVSGAGDVNGDGISDILIGARLANASNDRTAVGKTDVVFGRRDDLLSTSRPVKPTPSTPLTTGLWVLEHRWELSAVSVPCQQGLAPAYLYFGVGPQPPKRSPWKKTLRPVRMPGCL